MSKRLGIAVLLLVVLAAVPPFFHTDDHPAGCAVCAFMTVGNVLVTPEAPILRPDIPDFFGITRAIADPYVEIGVPARGGRAPPIVL